MAGAITIKVTPGCDPDTVTMTLSGAAEPNGGDHIASINWGGVGNVLHRFVQVEMLTGVDTWVAAPSAFLFTSDGDTYTLRARGVESLADWGLQLLFEYDVYAVYAPEWAKVEGVITATVDDEPCCTPIGEVYGTTVLHTRPNLGTTGVATALPPGCYPNIDTPPYTIHTGCNAFSITDEVDVLGSGPYQWEDLAGVFTLSLSNSHGCNSTTATGSVNVTCTKVAGTSYVHVTAVTNLSVSGTLTDDDVANNFGDVKKATANIPCSNFKFALDATFYTSCGIGGASSSVSFEVSMQYLEP